MRETLKVIRTACICATATAMWALTPVPVRTDSRDEVPKDLVPAGFAPQDCHFDQAREKEPIASSADDLQAAVRASADSKRQRTVRCARKTEVIHTTIKCTDANGMERPHDYCKEYGGEVPAVPTQIAPETVPHAGTEPRCEGPILLLGAAKQTAKCRPTKCARVLYS
jgi:hypothetical protein